MHLSTGSWSRAAENQWNGSRFEIKIYHHIRLRSGLEQRRWILKIISSKVLIVLTSHFFLAGFGSNLHMKTSPFSYLLLFYLLPSSFPRCLFLPLCFFSCSLWSVNQPVGHVFLKYSGGGNFASLKISQLFICFQLLCIVQHPHLRIMLSSFITRYRKPG